jgi:uncharacterized protein (UPF0335 family)
MKSVFSPGLLLAATILCSGGAVAEAGHGCGKCCGKPACCVVCCCGQTSERGSARNESVGNRENSAAVVPTVAPVVYSMPLFPMPMMMPTMAAPQAYYATQAPAATTESSRASRDCCDRVDRLESEMKDLAKAVNDLQVIVRGQTEIMAIIVKNQKADAGAPPAATSGS